MESPRGENLSVKSKNDIPIHDLSTSESKIPLKTPVMDEDEEVKYDSTALNEVNGDAKIDMNVVKCFSGMSKEELLKYANDPFWVRTRMFLFIFFWIVWIAMFIGAIAIIVVAPKCEPPKWYQQGHLYMLDIENFLNLPAEENEDLLKKLTSKIPYLLDLNVKGLVLTSILKFKRDDKKESVTDFRALDEKLGTIDDLKDFISAAEAKDMKVTMGFVPNHSSDKHVWFNRSVAKEPPYDGYYIWAPPSGVDSDGSMLPPNNWLSISGGSAWEWNDERNEFYLHQFDVDQPDLNFRNPHLIHEMNETLKFWLDLGIKGFSLDKVQYLLEDEDLQSEAISRKKTDAVHTDYEFYSHLKTFNLPETAKIVLGWKNLIHEKSKSNSVLMISGDPPLPPDGDGTPVADIVRDFRLLSGLTPEFTLQDLHPKLSSLVNAGQESWPPIQLGNENARLGARIKEEDIDGLNVITMLMKGTPITYFGEELGLSNRTYFPWTNETDSLADQEESERSHYNVFKALMKARESKSVVYGSSDLTVVNDCIIVLTRIKAGNPGYLSAYNVCHKDVVIDFRTVNSVPDELMVYVLSKNHRDETVKIKDKVSSSMFKMYARSAVVFTFVPKIEESN